MSFSDLDQYLFAQRKHSIMQWYYVSAVILVLSLQVASNAYVNAAVDYSLQNAEIKKLQAKIEAVQSFIESQFGKVVLSYGIKSTSDGTFVRALTSVPLANGEPALGVPLANAAVIKALNAKRTFKGVLELYGKNYTGVVEPILSKSKVVTGYYFAGVPL